MANQSTTARRQDENPQSQGRPRHELASVDRFVAYFRERAHADPEKFALTCLGVGFILGWKLKPW